MSQPRICACVLMAFALLGAVGRGEEPRKPSVFDIPVLIESQAKANRTVAEAFAAGKYDLAVAELRPMLERIPQDFSGRYNLACALARLGKADEALDALEKAVETGFRDAAHIENDEDLKSLRENERFKAIVKRAGEPLTERPAGIRYEVAPGEIADGQAIVAEGNTAWDNQFGLLKVLFNIDRKASEDKDICKGYGKAGDLLRAWQKDGAAAGNHGDLYDNHDGDHSNMKYDFFPQLTRIEYSKEAKQRGLHNGLQLRLLFNGVTLGNSSTAIVGGPIWRSQPRLALTQPRTAAILALQYRANHLYLYPEHRDYDPGHNGADGKGHGDVYPANTPYMIVSQGSSGSDVVFLNALAATLAAFRPEVKQELARQGLLMPTVQMIFRMSNKTVEKPADYLTGKAHPPVFDGKQIDAEKMVTLAHDIKPDCLPPLVQLRVIEEDVPKLGRDYFDVAPRERLFDTPGAIARVVKSTAYLRRMVVSAEASLDATKKPLTYHWVVLRGDAERIKIKPLNEAGSRVELLVPYHERRPIAEGSEMESNRVDIGAFVYNGEYYSAPAFVCFSYSDNEKRVYDEKHRIVSVDYADAEVKGNYFDPLLEVRRDWRDEYRYGDDGALLGWTRIRGDKREEFTPEGRIVLEKDDDGRPTKTAAVRYEARPGKDQRPELAQIVEEK